MRTIKIHCWSFMAITALVLCFGATPYAAESSSVNSIIMVGQLPKLFGISIDASGFFPKVSQIAGRMDQIHLPTLILGGSMLIVLIVLKRIAPSLPGALIVSAAGGIAVAVFNLQDLGVAVLGNVPGGLPALHVPSLSALSNATLLRDAAGIVLMSFTSGMLKVKSFARRNHYEVDANQELIAFGACNLASGLGQGFPVTGTGSRTAVNDATALGKIDELREELSAKGITLNFAGARHELTQFFKSAWTEKRGETEERFNFPTINDAVAAFRGHMEKQSTG